MFIRKGEIKLMPSICPQTENYPRTFLTEGQAWRIVSVGKDGDRYVFGTIDNEIGKYIIITVAKDAIDRPTANEQLLHGTVFSIKTVVEKGDIAGVIMTDRADTKYDSVPFRLSAYGSYGARQPDLIVPHPLIAIRAADQEIVLTLKDGLTGYLLVRIPTDEDDSVRVEDLCPVIEHPERFALLLVPQGTILIPR